MLNEPNGGSGQSPDPQGQHDDQQQPGTPSSGGEHVPNEGTPSAGTQQEQPTDGQQAHVPKSGDEDYERLKTKVSKLESERNQAFRYLEALNKEASGDPEFMKAINKRLVNQGVISQQAYEEALKGIEAQQQQQQPADAGGVTQQPEGQPQTQDPSAVKQVLDQMPEVQYARQKYQEDMADQERFFTDFESDKPDISEGTREEQFEKRRAITIIAQANVRKGMDKKKAYDMAYIQYMHPEKLREEGEIEGLVQRQSTPTISGGGGKSSKGGSSKKLSQDEVAAADALGISHEEYAKYRDTDPDPMKDE